MSDVFDRPPVTIYGESFRNADEARIILHNRAYDHINPVEYYDHDAELRRLRNADTGPPVEAPVPLTPEEIQRNYEHHLAKRVLWNRFHNIEQCIVCDGLTFEEAVIAQIDHEDRLIEEYRQPDVSIHPYLQQVIKNPLDRNDPVNSYFRNNTNTLPLPRKRFDKLKKTIKERGQPWEARQRKKAIRRREKNIEKRQRLQAKQERYNKANFLVKFLYRCQARLVAMFVGLGKWVGKVLLLAFSIWFIVNTIKWFLQK